MIRQKPEPKKKAQPAPVDAGDLKRFADRIDNLEEERVAIVGDIKDVFTEVKSKGYNAKALRKVLADRRKKTDEELEADMEMYRAALAEPGATYRSVAERHGIPKTNLHRLVPKSTRGTGGGQPDSDLGAAAGDETVAPATPAPKPEDGDDGITESCGGVESRHATDPQQPSCRASGAVAAPAGVASGPHDTSAEATLPGHVTSPFPPSHHPKSAPDLQGGLSDDDPRWENLPPTTPSVGAVAAEPRVAISVLTPHVTTDDDLTIPAHLRGPSPANRRVA